MTAYATSMDLYHNRRERNDCLISFIMSYEEAVHKYKDINNILAAIMNTFETFDDCSTCSLSLPEEPYLNIQSDIS